MMHRPSLRPAALLLGLCGALVSAPSWAQEDVPPPAETPPEPQPEPAPTAPPAAVPSVVPRYVVWRIKPGTGAGALAPRIERRLRTVMEDRLGGEMLSKAAQTGIILIRPELADCDANLPCALDVAEALSIRFIIGGEAVVAETTSVTAWVIDLERRGEVKRVTLPLTATGEEAETALAQQIAEQLLAPPKVAAAEAQMAPRVTPAAAAEEDEARGRPMLAGLAGAGVAALGGGALLTLLGGAAALGSGAVFTYVKETFHTRAAANAAFGTLATGGVLVGVGVLLALAILPVAALGAVAMTDLP